jgi:excisionase family DNA binding protein
MKGTIPRLLWQRITVTDGDKEDLMMKLLKVPEAAEMLALSQKTVWQWIGERRIGVVRLGRAVRVPISEIERLLEEGTTPARRG